MKRIPVIDLLKAGEVGATVTTSGWVRTKRESKNVAFIALNDGSIIHNIQVVVDMESAIAGVLGRIS
ncbi:MAG: OB-fold nucleic acid binding domain-containing protein, partial [bacterium]